MLLTAATTARLSLLRTRDTRKNARLWTDTRLDLPQHKAGATASRPSLTGAPPKPMSRYLLGGQQSPFGVPTPQNVDKRQRNQYGPALPDDLAGQEVQAPKGEP